MSTDRHDATALPRQRRLLRSWICVAALALAGCASTPRGDASPPLLQAAENLFYVNSDRNERTQGDILASFVLLGGLSQRYGASSGDCRETECRQAFSDALHELGAAYGRLGLDRIALRYYELALANLPDSTGNRVDLAIAQLALGRDEAALASIGEALKLAPDDDDVERAAAGILLLLDRPQDAIGHAENCIRRTQLPRAAQYCALTATVARLRGGSDSMVAPLVGGETWPMPLLDYLRGKIDAATLARIIAHASDPVLRREALSEALYYVGEAELARGHRELALRYFRANLAMKVEGYWETMASRRRVLQFGGSDDPPANDTPPSHIPIS